MTLIEQSYLQSLLSECEANFGREQKQAQNTVLSRLQQVYNILKRNIKYTFSNFSLQIIVRFMQFAVQINQKFSYADEFVNLFFQRVTSPSQYYIRALLVKAKLITYKGHKNQSKGEAMIIILKQSIQQINKALDLISGPNQPAQKGKDSKGAADSNKAKYGFLIYNASACLYKIIRFMLRQNWQKNFTQIVERIYKLFDQIDEPDQNWKCRFMLILFQCLYDSDKKPDAWKILDLLWQKAKAKNVDFLDSLFRLRVHYSKQNNALTNIIKKDIQGADPNGWKILQVLQRMKSGAIPEAQVQKQLMGVVNQISLGVLSTNQQSASVTLSHVMQQRLGEAGRIALKFNLINIANSITNFLAKARQPNQKAMILNEYNKAQLLIKKKNEFINKKTGMMMNAAQIKELQIQRRKQALKILQKVMMANKKLDNPDLIYQGSILIWNISLPFLCPQYRQCIAKAFDYSCQLLQQIDSIDHDLRTKMHLQLAKIYFGNEKMFPQVQKNITKALRLDHSIPSNKVQHKFEPEQDPSLYYRPLQRYLNNFREKIMLKTLQILDRSSLDDVVNDLWNVVEQKLDTARIDTLQKCLRTLMQLQEQKFIIDQSKMMVQQQIKQQKILFEQKKLKNYKKKKLLAYEVAQLAFQWQLNQFAKKAAKFVLSDKWQGKNSIQLIIAQARCCYFLAQIQIDELIQDNFQIPYAQPVQYQNDDPKQLTQQKKKEVQAKKKSIFQTLTKGLQLSQSIQQHWLVFNGSIYIWNNFLHVFRNPINDSKLHKDLTVLLKKNFESMKNSLKQIESKGIVYYDLDTKIQTFANIGLIYARLMQFNKQPDQVIKICDALLVTPLSPHTRKLTNSIKARVTGSGGGKAAGGAAKDQKKGGKQVSQQKPGGYSDSFLFQIFSQLQIIQNSTNKNETQNLIKKCFESLESWQPKDKDETQLQLHAELWARLARLAVNEANVTMYKYALRCSQYSLSLLPTDKNISAIPPNRLRWYSLSQFLYSECLFKIANPETQDVQSYQKLLFAALQHAVEATNKGYRSNINALVVDGAKQVWNVCSKLQQSKKNRVKLIQPLKNVLHYLKQIKQESQADLILLLAQLFFKSANQNNQNKLGQQVADSLFNVIPKSMQKSLWQAKMAFMSKQGKNQLQAISNMKQADPSLQSKLWVKLARMANNQKKQHAAYNKAIDILKKQNSIQIVEVLIQYSEWQLRVGNQKVKNVISSLLLASDYLIDIQFGDEDQEDEADEEDKGTVFSRSTRGKKSHTSKSVKSSIKSSKVTKKVSQKKGQSSNKSKAGSSMSRMNRSGRAAKTIKSKNTKSIFTQRQQDPNPQSLNCIHFQRLFRIHTILSMISENVANRIRYALDAKQFLIKILDLSFKTLNQIQQNTLKYSDKKKQQQAKLKVPSNLKQWVDFQLSKQIIDKIKTLQDPNFMGSYTFQKPELTLSYIKNLTSILNSYGLDYHTIPLYFFQKFITNELLGNKNHLEVACLQMKYVLKKIGYIDSQKPNITQVNPQKYKINQLESKMQMIKTRSKVVVQQSDSNIFQNVQPPNLVQPLTNHEAWFQIGKILSKLGEIYIAKIYLKQAYKHFMILGNSENAGECCIQQLIIARIQGQNQQAMQYALAANKLCKQPKNWQNLLYHSCSLLLCLQKYQDIANFGSKIYNTIQQILASLKKQNSPKFVFQSQIIELKDILTLVEIIDLDVRFTQSFQEEIVNPVKGVLAAVQILDHRINTGDLWAISNYSYFLVVSAKIVQFFVFGKEKSTHINITVFDKTFGLLLKIQKKIFQLMKYTLVGSGPEFKKNSLIQLYQKYRNVIANAYAYQSVQSVGGQMILNQQQQQGRQQVSQLVDLKNQHFKKFMDTLNIQIQKKIMPVPLNLSPIQSSISILQNIKTNLSAYSYEMVEWKVNFIRALTLKARSNGSLDNIWSAQSKQIQQELASVCLLLMTEFLQKNYEEKMLDFSKNLKCFQLGQKLYQSFIENTGQQINDRSFEFLCKLQHCCYQTRILDIIRKNLTPSHKFNSYLNLIQYSKLESQKIKSVLQKDKIFNCLSKFPNYQDCLNLIPRNGVYVVLQMNLNCSQLYCGILTNDKSEDKYLINTRIIKKKIQKPQYIAYCLLKQKLNKLKKQIVYLAYADAKKMDNILQEKQKSIQQIHEKFIKMNEWWHQILLQIINKVKQVPPPVQVDKNKKGAKDTSKKGGKDQIIGYQSPLGASPAGYQSITFLIDQFFNDLPFNILPGLEAVPSISFDSSIFYLTRKMQSIGFKAQANNSNGFAADKGKFISYQFKNPELGFKSIAAQITKQNANLKFDGVSSNDRIPSVGDYKKYINEVGYLQIYGSLDLLDHIKIPVLLQSCGLSKLRLLIIFDHLNYQKSLINKFISLDQESFSNSIDNQTRILRAVANLLDVNLIKNSWCSTKQQNLKLITTIYKNLGSGYYLGACLNTKQQNPNTRLIEKYMIRVHGCPVLRM